MEAIKADVLNPNSNKTAVSPEGGTESVDLDDFGAGKTASCANVFLTERLDREERGGRRGLEPLGIG